MDTVAHCDPKNALTSQAQELADSGLVAEVLVAVNLSPNPSRLDDLCAASILVEPPSIGPG